MLRTILSLSLVTFACSPTSPNFGDHHDDNDAGVDAPPTGNFGFGDASIPETQAPEASGTCDPPDMLVVLDRSCSMSSIVGGSSKTRQQVATEAIDFFTKAPTDTTVRFGLELLPGDVITIADTIVYPPALSAGSKIATYLTTMPEVCDTPIGGALQGAQTELQKVKVSGRPQYVVLITDGGETDMTEAQDTAIAQSLYKAGIVTYAVGFGGDDDPSLLNRVACAGHTANDMKSCTCINNVCDVSASLPIGTTLYYKAVDEPALKAAVASITNNTCCACTPLNPN
jgi:hypothetical protein